MRRRQNQLQSHPFTIEEPDNSLSMGDEHLDTIPETESDEVIKSSVENLVPIPSESEGIPDKMCDVPLYNNPTSLNALNEHSEIVVNSNDDSTSSDDDSYENIEYVDASLPDVEISDREILTSIDLGFRKMLHDNVTCYHLRDQSSPSSYFIDHFLLFSLPVVPPYLLFTKE
ncbi:hypothetical protein Tco_0509594 [Tanacetum coccineum]